MHKISHLGERFIRELEPAGVRMRTLLEMETWLNTLPLPHLERWQFDALGSWAYHCDLGFATTIYKSDYRTCGLIHKVCIGHLQLAAGEFDNWTVYNGKYDQTLIERRAKECALFLTGRY